MTQHIRVVPWSLVLLVAFAIAIRLSSLDLYTLHEDEALYAAYSLYIANTGDIFLSNWTGFSPDKHPLFFWIVAIFIKTFGNSELVIRLPNIIADAISTTLIFLIADRFGGRQAAVLAGCFYALSLLGVLYGATVFIDPTAIGLGLLGLYLAISGLPAVAGVALGLSATSKLLGAIYVPIALVMVFRQGGIKSSVRFTMSCFGILALMIVWQKSSTFGHAITNLGFQLSAPDVWSIRISQLFHLLEQLFAPLGTMLILLAGIVGATVAAITSSRDTRAFLLSMGAASVLYVAAFVVIQPIIYDRYSLYLLPILCIAGGIGLAYLLQRIPHALGRRMIFASVILFLVVGSLHTVRQTLSEETWHASRSRSGTFGGYAQLCQWLWKNSGEQVVWNRSLSWHFAYCLQGSGVDARWFPSTDVVLSSDVEGTALLALSRTDDATILQDIRKNGWELKLLKEFGGLQGLDLWVYQIHPGIASASSAATVDDLNRLRSKP